MHADRIAGGRPRALPVDQIHVAQPRCRLHHRVVVTHVFGSPWRSSYPSDPCRWRRAIVSSLHVIHLRAVERGVTDLRGHPPPPLPDRAHRRVARARSVPLLRGAGRALPARVRPGALARRRTRPARCVDHHVQRARGGRAQGGARAARGILRGLRPHAGGRRRDAARPHERRVHELSPRRGVRLALSRGAGRALALLLDLLGGGQGARAQGLARSALLAVDRHLRLRGVRQRGARGARVRRHRRRGARARGARRHDSPTSRRPAATSGCSGTWGIAGRRGRSDR